MAAYLSALCFVVCLGYVLGEGAVLGPDTWVVLVAGSNGWYNNRHQADICHAYHILIQKGVKKERIITMLFDDIANSSYNPDYGSIKNR
ncbi:C13 family peptidase, partial [Shewanella sp. A25]|nr:C13 family peptidase [Shewanella shenzhenensis]